MTDDRERWALILGGSSGMGEATAKALAAAGYKICGIHLDFRAALTHVEDVKAAIVAAGSEALYINMNAADDEKRAAALATLEARFAESRAAGRHPYVRVVMHSLAFGSLVPYIADDSKAAVDRKKMEMTQDVMANSLVYWVQDLVRGGFLERGSKIYAMTSEGSSRVVPSYGVVSSAKAALESHIRQLAMELARRDSGITANSIQAGVTITPALMKIPEHDEIIRIASARNPTGRLTTPQDVANAIVALSQDGLELINGNIVRVDGAEFVTG
jgi:enoyl-[acyl-carrier protein] reductase III